MAELPEEFFSVRIIGKWLTSEMEAIRRDREELIRVATARAENDPTIDPPDRSLDARSERVLMVMRGSVSLMIASDLRIANHRLD
jgi:hypothetical protein